MRKIFLLFFLLNLYLNATDITYLIKSFLYKKDDNKIININSIELNKNLKIYDATLYINKNIENEKIFPKLNLIYQRKLWTNWDDIKSREFVDKDKISETAKELLFSDSPYIIDIEHWDVHTLNDDIAMKNIDKYIEVITLFKKLRPDLKFGFYGVLPNRDYWSSISSDFEKINNWNIINKRLKKLAEYVDIICPSLYTFYDNEEDWNIYAIENIKRAKEYGKPIYAFIWPQFHRSNKVIGGEYLGSDFFKNQLNLLKNIDSIVIWGGWDSSKIGKERKLEWKEENDWWKITKAFIISNNLK